MIFDIPWPFEKSDMETLPKIIECVAVFTILPRPDTIRKFSKKMFIGYQILFGR